MEILGIWPFSESHVKYYMKVALSLIYDAVCIFVVWGEIARLLCYVDMLLSIEGILLTGTGIVTIVKNIMYIIKRKQLQELIYQMDDLCTNTPIKQSYKIEKNLGSYMHRCKVIMIFCICLTSSVSLAYSITPWIKRYTSGEIELPYPQIYPFDIYKWSVYVPIYVANVLVGIICSVSFTADSMIVGLILFLCTRIDLLLEALQMSIEETKVNKKVNENPFILFKACADYQLKIYR